MQLVVFCINHNYRLSFQNGHMPRIEKYSSDLYLINITYFVLQHTALYMYYNMVIFIYLSSQIVRSHFHLDGIVFSMNHVHVFVVLQVSLGVEAVMLATYNFKTAKNL